MRWPTQDLSIAIHAEPSKSIPPGASSVPSSASPFQLSSVVRCNISKSIPTFRGTSVPSVFFLGGTSVPSILFFGWDICSSLSSSVADCLFGHGPKQVFSHWPRVFLNHSFSLPQGGFIPAALVWIRGSSSRSIGRLSELHWFATSTSVFFLVESDVGRFSWALQEDHRTKPPTPLCGPRRAYQSFPL